MGGNYYNLHVCTAVYMHYVPRDIVRTRIRFSPSSQPVPLRWCDCRTKAREVVIAAAYRSRHSSYWTVALSALWFCSPAFGPCGPSFHSSHWFWSRGCYVPTRVYLIRDRPAWSLMLCCVLRPVRRLIRAIRQSVVRPRVFAYLRSVITVTYMTCQ